MVDVRHGHKRIRIVVGRAGRRDRQVQARGGDAVAGRLEGDRRHPKCRAEETGHHAAEAVPRHPHLAVGVQVRDVVVQVRGRWVVERALDQRAPHAPRVACVRVVPAVAHRLPRAVDARAAAAKEQVVIVLVALRRASARQEARARALERHDHRRIVRGGKHLAAQAALVPAELGRPRPARRIGQARRHRLVVRPAREAREHAQCVAVRHVGPRLRHILPRLESRQVHNGVRWRSGSPRQVAAHILEPPHRPHHRAHARKRRWRPAPYDQHERKCDDQREPRPHAPPLRLHAAPAKVWRPPSLSHVAGGPASDDLCARERTRDGGPARARAHGQARERASRAHAAHERTALCVRGPALQLGADAAARLREAGRVARGAGCGEPSHRGAGEARPRPVERGQAQHDADGEARYQRRGARVHCQRYAPALTQSCTK